MNPLLDKAYTAGAAIGANRIVKFGTSDDEVIQSAAATDNHIGVGPAFAVDSGERMDVTLDGIAEVVCGGTVTRGADLTANATGQAVAAAATNSIIGRALQSGVSGQIIPVHLSHGMHT